RAAKAGLPIGWKGLRIRGGEASRAGARRRFIDAENLEKIVQVPDLVQEQRIATVPASPPRRHEGRREAQLGRLLQSLIALAHRPYLAAQADFAETYQILRHGNAGECGDESSRDREVRCRFRDPEAPGDL